MKHSVHLGPFGRRRHPPRTGRLATLALGLAIALGAWLAVALPDGEAAAAPTVSAVSPATGPKAGGTALTITGSGFVAGASVSVGGVSAAGVVVVSPTSITATTGATATAGAAVVRVTNADTQSGTLSGAFTYLELAPTVTNVAPPSGSSLGGTVTTITGTDFVAGATVSFDGSGATGVVVSNATTITATAPAHSAGAVDVVVANPDTQTGTMVAGYTYTAASVPTVTAVSPASGTTGGGTSITVTGTNFASGATVKLDGVAATSVVVVNATTITARTPTHAAGAVAVVVTNADTQSGTLGAGFSYAASAAPTITSVSPTSGPIAGGTAVTITGSGFLAGATVTVGGTAATGITVASSTQITATTPARTAGAAAIVVTNTDAQTATLASPAFTYLGAPTVTGVTPASGPLAGGTEVNIAGTNFASGATVTFDGQTATSVVVTSATEIAAVTPSGAAGAVDVVVSVAGQPVTKAAAYTYTAGPTVMSAEPLEGPAAGGILVTIEGTGFGMDTTVSFGSDAGTSVTVAADGLKLTAKTPAHAAGSVAVTVTTSGGQTATLLKEFVYLAPPGLIVSGRVQQGSIALVVFSGGNDDLLVKAATTEGGCPNKDLLGFHALVGGSWYRLFPAAPKAVNAAWTAQFASGLAPNTPLFIRCNDA